MCGSSLDPNWNWEEVTSPSGHVRWVRTTCNHLKTIPVESYGKIVSHLCLTCDEQLP